MINERQLSYEILKSTYIDNQYANLLMRRKLDLIEKRKRPFISELVYGVIRNDLLLKSNFKKYINNKTKMSLIIILMMAYYEKHFMHHDNYVVVNEYVSLTSKHQKGFINAILRNHLDEFNSYDNPKNIEEISIKYSIPLWILKLLKAQYDEDTFKYIINDYQNNKPNVFYRINYNKANKDMFNDLNIEYIDDYCFISKENLLDSYLFKEGYCYIQDPGSQKIAANLDVDEDDKVIDVCAAPGSKTFNILEKLKNHRNYYINDLSKTRLELIKSKAINLGYQDLNFLNIDGRKIGELNLQFDAILLDVPCSGLGVIKRKVDLKNKIKPSNLDELIVIQKQLLESASNNLKINGKLVYGTCTYNRKENQTQIKKFLENHDDFKLIKDELILPKNGSDAFYLAKLVKIK